MTRATYKRKHLIGGRRVVVTGVGVHDHHGSNYGSRRTGMAAEQRLNAHLGTLVRDRKQELTGNGLGF